MEASPEGCPTASPPAATSPPTNPSVAPAARRGRLPAAPVAPGGEILLQPGLKARRANHPAPAQPSESLFSQVGFLLSQELEVTKITTPARRRVRQTARLCENGGGGQESRPWLPRKQRQAAPAILQQPFGISLRVGVPDQTGQAAEVALRGSASPERLFEMRYFLFLGIICSRPF
jgi:hypothetical protein